MEIDDVFAKEHIQRWVKRYLKLHHKENPHRFGAEIDMCELLIDMQTKI